MIFEAFMALVRILPQSVGAVLHVISAHCDAHSWGNTLTTLLHGSYMGAQLDRLSKRDIVQYK